MIKNLAHLSYHILVLLLSAAIALAIPHLFGIMAEKLLSFWTYIENEKVFLVSLEISTAMVLIFMFNYLRQGWQARKLSRLATSAGLLTDSPLCGRSLGWKSNTRKNAVQGGAGNIMIIGSTGLRTFADPLGELHHAVRNCRQAKILLLHPRREGATVRARSIPDPEITAEVIRDQIMKSIDFLKELKAVHKNIRLKLYPEVPLLKLAIIGEYAILRHYHTDLNVRQMPEFVFTSDSIYGGLYLPLYRYFLSRWQDPALPEYDLETDELMLRNQEGREVHREQPEWFAPPAKERRTGNISALDTIGIRDSMTDPGEIRNGA